MSKRPRAVYEPGELDRVRQKIGPLDPREAKRMAELLGGEVGIERSDEQDNPLTRPSIHKKTVEVVVPGSSKRTGSVEVMSPAAQRRQRQQQQRQEKTISREKKDPSDDPSVPFKAGWLERLKMDRFAAQPSFEIKNSGQTLSSVFGIFSPPPDYVNPDFVSGRLSEYYSSLQTLVVNTRSLLPRNNPVRGDKLQRLSPFAYKVLDVIRSWPLEVYSSCLAKLQASPRDVLVSDCIDILRSVYRPLFLLERLDSKTHILECYKLAFKIVSLEDPDEARRRYQPAVRAAMAALEYTREHIHYLLYPLLMKAISDSWFSYRELFVKRRRRFLSFIGVEANAQIAVPSRIVPENTGEKSDEESGKPDSAKATASPVETPPPRETFDPSTMPTAVRKGLETLDMLFPEAGMKKLWEFPDLFPYFKDVFDMPKGFELIAPEDPMQQAIVLIHILEEFFYGLRYVSFGSVPDNDGELVHIDQKADRIMSSWHDFIERLLVKEYYSRLTEYCRVLDNAAESRTSRYAVNLFGETLWIKRIFFMPRFSFENMLAAPPFRNQELPRLHESIHELRRILTHVAAGIEKGMKAGGASTNADCPGIDNPWASWVFQVPNPVSLRIEALLPERKTVRRTNAALVFFTLSVVSVLDYILNDPGSWSYLEREYYPYRSVDGRGNKALYGTEGEIDTMYLFREALRMRQATARENAARENAVKSGVAEANSQDPAQTG